MITSVNNERIKNYAKLNDKKYREQTNLFLIEGQHLVEEALKKDLVKDIFIAEGEVLYYEDAEYVSYEVMKKLTTLANPPKIIAVCHKQEKTDVVGNAIILDDISDPGNLGTIIRSAVAFNYHTIILSPNTVDIYNPKVIRATEGMLFNINVVISDLKEIITRLKQDNYLIIGTNVKNGKNPEKTTGKHALIIGSEAKGMSEEITSLTDHNLYIKMNPICESLNAAISASILMHQLNN